MAKRPQESSTITEIREIALKREQKTHPFGGYTAASVGRETTACRTKVILIGMVPFLLVLALALLQLHASSQSVGSYGHLDS